MQHLFETDTFPEEAGFIEAHPDDADALHGAAMQRVQKAYVVVATNGGMSTLDFRSNRLCRRI